ncbi:hypothetical protein BGZ67_003448 [Mortierella alpina]|nr:hypothetical protein BGZ67_003448 [Mortierella alpina]
METEFESRPLRPGSLIWSEDNVLALVTPSNLHIFAPLLRCTVDPSSANFIVSSIPAQTLEHDNAPWKLTTHGIGILECCLVADRMLSYQKHVTLDRYITAYWDAEQEVDLEMADKIECVSLAWSPKIFVNDIGSLLALGNKSGDITIWNVVDPQDVRCVTSMDTSGGTWVTQISWSPWMVGEGSYVAMLAYSLADGTVHVRKVRFNPTAPLENIDVSENIMDLPAQSLHPCTVLRWSTTLPEAGDRPNNLAFSKGNRLYIWLPETNRVLVWRKPIAKAISDISWDAFGTKVFVFFMDGKHSVLNVLDDDLRVNEDHVEFVHQHIISRCHLQSKTNLTQEDGEADDDGGDEEAVSGGVGSKLQLHIVCGNRSAEGFQLATAYHVSSSFHMEFQRERFQSCTMMLTNTYKDVSEQTGDVLLKRLAAFIRLPNAAVMDEDDTSLTESMRTFARREVMEGNSASFKSRLESALFSDVSVNADRVNLYLWSQLKPCSLRGDTNILLQTRAKAAEARIRRHHTRNILKYFLERFAAIPTAELNNQLESRINERDQILLLLQCDSILLFHRNDTEMLNLAEKTYNLLQSQSQDLCDIDEQKDMLQSLHKGVVSSITSFNSGRESCPACGAEVKLDNELKGTCANGHTWQRCSVTLQLIADFHPRTCSGCSRKVLMVPASKTQPSPLHDSDTAPWLEVTLRAMSVCGFCGERLFTALRRKGT